MPVATEREGVDGLFATLVRWNPRLKAAVGEPDGPDWMGATDLLSDGERAALLDHVRAYGVKQGTQDVRPGASLWVRRYAAILAAPAIAGLVLDAPLVDPSPRNVAVRFKQGEPVEVAFRPDAAVVRAADLGGKAGLRQWLHARLFEAHLRPLLAVIRALTRLNEHMLWETVGVGCARNFVLALGQCRTRPPEELMHEAEAFFATPPLPSRAGTLLRFEHAGRTGIVLERATCCIKFRLGTDTRDRRCAECSLQSSEQRARRRPEWLKD